MNEREYRRLKLKIESDYQRDIAALERVWAMSGGGPQAGEAGSDSFSATAAGAMQSIREVVRGMEGRFGVPEIQRRLRECSNGVEVKRSTVSAALSRMQDIVQLVEAGRGRRPSIYEPKNPKMEGLQ